MDYLKHFNPNHDPSNGRFTFGDGGFRRGSLSIKKNAKTTYKNAKKAFKNGGAHRHDNAVDTIGENIKISDEDVNKLKKLHSEYADLANEFYKNKVPEIEKLAENYYDMYVKDGVQMNNRDLATAAFENAVDRYNWAGAGVEADKKFNEYYNEAQELGKKYSSIYADKKIGNGSLEFKTYVDAYLMSMSSPSSDRISSLDEPKNKFIAKHEKGRG